MIRMVTYKSWRFGGGVSEAVVLRKVGEEQSVSISFPFLEDTPNIELTIPEALDLRNALDDVIGPIKRLEPPKPDLVARSLFPETFISVKDQSALSGLLDKFPLDTEAHITARNAIREAIRTIGLIPGGYDQ